MTDTVYCEECGAQLSHATKFCTNCGTEQTPSSRPGMAIAAAGVEPRSIKADPAAGPPPARMRKPDREVTRPPAFPAPPATRGPLEARWVPVARTVDARADAPSPARSSVDAGPAQVTAPPSGPGYSATPYAPTVRPTGTRLGRALRQARDQRDTQVLASFWLGWGALALILLDALIAKTGGVFGTPGLAAAIAAIVTARFARQRGRATGNSDLVYLSRYGQIIGWTIVGLVVLAIVFLAVVTGAFLGSHASSR
jgi:hypothetical protein